MSSEGSSDSEVETSRVRTVGKRPPDSFAGGWGFARDHGGTQAERLGVHMAPPSPADWHDGTFLSLSPPPHSTRDLITPSVSPEYVCPLCSTSPPPAPSPLDPPLRVRQIRTGINRQSWLRKVQALEAMPVEEKRATRRMIAGLRTAQDKKSRTKAYRPRLWCTDACSVTTPLKDEILTWAGFEGSKAENWVDVFASKAHHQFPRFWTAKQDAFKQDWSGDQHLWINGPFGKMKEISEKILLDGAKGLAIIPVWKQMDWFWALGEVALDWWDIASDVSVFQTHHGQVFP